MKTITFILYIFLSSVAVAQDGDAIALAIDANKYYEKQVYAQAGDLYYKALRQARKNAIIRYNYAASLEKQNLLVEAIKQYGLILITTTDKRLHAKVYYNKGVIEIKEQLIADAIESFKQALRINPDDNDARENLQKALQELHKQKTTIQAKHYTDAPISKNEMEQLLNKLRNDEAKMSYNLQRQRSQKKSLEKDW